MGAPTPTESSLRAIDRLREEVEQLGLWTKAWVGVLAVRKDEAWIVFQFKVHLVTPGAEIPNQADLFDVTTKDVRFRAVVTTLEDCWQILKDLAEGKAERLGEVIGQQVEMPPAENPAIWSKSSQPGRRPNNRVCLAASVGVITPFYKIFGYELWDDIPTQLRKSRPPYDSLEDIVKGMSFINPASCSGNNAYAVFEVTCEFPITLGECTFSREERGLKLSLERRSVRKFRSFDRFARGVDSRRCE